MNTPICTEGRESLSQSTLWTAHPNTSKFFGFKFTFASFMVLSFYISWENSLLPHFCKCIFIYSSLYILPAINGITQRPRWRREQMLLSHPGTMARNSHLRRGNPHSLGESDSSHRAVHVLPAELWSGWASVEAPHLEHLLFTARHSWKN